MNEFPYSEITISGSGAEFRTSGLYRHGLPEIVLLLGSDAGADFATELLSMAIQVVVEDHAQGVQDPFWYLGCWKMKLEPIAGIVPPGELQLMEEGDEVGVFSPAIHRSIDLLQQQQAVCNTFSLAFDPPISELIVGYDDAALRAETVTGMRRRMTDDFSGWVFGADALDAGARLKYSTLGAFLRLVPAVRSCVALPPGTRFRVSDQGVEVWDDPTILGGS